MKVLAVEGNRIKLSRKAILKEQRAKMGGAPVPEGTEAPEGGSENHGGEGSGDGVRAPAGTPALTLEGGGDFPRRGTQLQP